MHRPFRVFRPLAALLCPTLALFTDAFPQARALGKGSYLVERTAAVTKVPSDTWAPYVTPDYSQKVLSNKWWGTLMTKPYSGQLWAQPCAYMAEAGGLQLDYPGAPAILANEPKRRIFEAAFLPDLKVGIAGLNAPAARVARVGHWSVTARWDDGARQLEATLAQGSPFAWFSVKWGNALVTTSGTPSIWHNQGGVLALTVNKAHWALFAPTGSVWQGSKLLSSSLAGKDYLSVALLPDSSAATLELFRKYAYSFTTDTKVSWVYDEAKALLTTKFQAVTVAKEGDVSGTLFALFPHQWLNSSADFAPQAYRTVRGPMRITQGASFSTAMTFNGILPVLPDTGHDPARLAGFLKNTQPRDGAGNPYIVPTETYTSGKSMNRFGEAAQICGLIGDRPERDRFLKPLRATLENWFSADTGAQAFFYHAPSNRFIGYPQSFFTGEKGNDHSLHWGYFINAAATLAQFDPDWGRPGNWGGMVEMLIRDVAAWDPADPLFEPFSYFDPYGGHGWLDGEGFDIGNNHESSSESLNFDAALIKWGLATGNRAIRDLGIFLYVHETRATEQYWWDVDRINFPPGWSYPSVGLVWTNGGRFFTWFSEEPFHVTGIQYIPNTGGHLYLGRRPEKVMRNFQVANPQINHWGWYDLHLQYLAYADADSAFALYQRHRADTITGEVTESPAHTYYHIASLKAVGRLDTTVTADYPAYGVFRKGAVRTYAAANYDAQPRRVSFSDGFALDVPAHSQAKAHRTLGPDALLPPATPRGAAFAGRTRLITAFAPGARWDADAWVRSLRPSAAARRLEFFDLGGRLLATADLDNGSLRNARSLPTLPGKCPCILREL